MTMNSSFEISSFVSNFIVWIRTLRKRKAILGQENKIDAGMLFAFRAPTVLNLNVKKEKRFFFF